MISSSLYLNKEKETIKMGKWIKIDEGKTKIIWGLPGAEIVKIESKSEITAGDGVKRDTIQGKDVLSNNTTCNVFELLERKGIETHFIQRLSGNSFLAYGCNMIPVEVVVRRIATGSYLKRNPDVKDGTVFDELVVEFFYKDDDMHDPIMILEDNEILLYDAKKPIEASSFIGTFDDLSMLELAKVMEERAKEIFLILEESFKNLGTVLWDLKIEFGWAKTGEELVVADVIDNDSWRIRDKEGNQLDKQVYRDGGSLKEVKNLYEIVSNITDKFSSW